jgi:hypothetical protein
MLAEADAVEIVAALRAATPVYREAKGIMRAARLNMLPSTNAHVASGTFFV